MADAATLHIGFIAYGPDSATPPTPTARKVSNAIAASAHQGWHCRKTRSRARTRTSRPCRSTRSTSSRPAEKAQRQFQVTQSWTVRTNAKDAARFLDIAVKAGANQSGADRLVPRGRERPAGRSRRQGPAASPHRSGADGLRHERQARRPDLRQQRDRGLTGAAA